MKKWLLSIPLLSLLASSPSAESLRGEFRGELVPDGPGLTLGLDDLAQITLPAGSKFARAVEVEITIPRDVFPYRSNLAVFIYQNFNPAKSTGDRIGIEVLPPAAKFYLQAPLVAKAGLKAAVEHRGAQDVAVRCRFAAGVRALLADARRAGRKIYLASASNERYVEAIAAHVGADGWFASSATENFSGEAKARRLVEVFGEKAFDYIGNDKADLPVWRVARQCVAVQASAPVRRRLRAIAPDARNIAPPAGAKKAWIKLLRVHQWAKNTLVFVPLLTSLSFNLASLAHALGAFLAFSFAASAVYILNDLVDLEADRKHPSKQRRPLASGATPIFQALLAMAGLATAAAGLALAVSPLFALVLLVLFVGIGVDFGIQYSVRYRAERHDFDNLAEAIARAGYHFGAPLTLAGLATACGFLSFAPTDYKGVSELGIIAGQGMIVAFVVSVTLLPALIYLLNPAGEPEPMGYAGLAPVDEFMSRHRKAIIAGVALVVAAGLPLFHWLSFDFNPIHLRDAKTESVATYLDLKRDRNLEIDNIQLLAPNLAEANQKAARLAQVAEVAHVRTLASLVPTEQDEKRAVIAQTATALKDSLKPAEIQPPPTDAEVVDSLNEAAQRLEEAAQDPHNASQSAGIAGAKRLAAALTALAQAPPEKRAKASEVMVAPLVYDLDQLRQSLQPERVALENLPPELVKDWRTPDGRERLSIAPKDQSGSEESLRAFAQAVLKVEPNATEGPVSILQASETIVGAFFEAGGWALLSIAILLIVMLRKISDMLLTLIPLILAAVVTLELTVLLGMPLNFANIIALPLLLGVGVAFKIYYIMAWRQGQTNLLQTSLTRAVMFSAATTATAFGSLWFSSHPGTSSMGELLALSLLCTLAAAVLFQPILMGKPRQKPADAPVS